jgi:hypothetical protein
MASVQEILSSPRIDPTFSYRPSDAKALGQDMSIQRGSAGWVRDPGTGLIKKIPSGQARITGASQELLIEPQSYQELSSPQNLSNSSWDKLRVNVLTNQGTEFGLDYDTLEEDTSTGTDHFLREDTFSTGFGDNIAISAIARPNGRDWIYFQTFMQDQNSNNINGGYAWFNLQTGEAKSSNINVASVSIANHEVDEWHGGWVRPKLTLDMPSDRRVIALYYGLANGDEVINYDGQGSGYGVDLLHTQFASGTKIVTSPILDGSATRNEDEVKFTIPESDWNTGEGTYFLDFTLRQHPTDFPDIFSSDKAEIVIRDDGSAFAFDRVSNNISNVIGGLRPLQRNRLIVSTERDGRWGIALNGSDSQKSSSDHQNAFVGERPNPGFLGRPGKSAAFSLQEARYLPRYLPKERRKIETALT